MPKESYRKELEDTGQALARGARTELGAWLSLPAWSWYVTNTFKANFVARKQADRYWYGWFNSLRMSAKAAGLTPSVYGPAAPFYFRVAEYQERGTLHYHALVGGVGDIRRLSFKDLWQHHGYARVEKYEPALGASHYVAKYLNKAGGDIRFSHNLTPYLTMS